MKKGEDSPPAFGRSPTAFRLALLGVLAAALAAYFYFDLDRYVSIQSLSEHREELLALVERYGASAWALYVLVYALVAAFSLPGGAVLTICGGFLFGPVTGTALALLGATLGATAIFLAARYAFHDWLLSKAGPFVRRMEAGFRENAVSYMLFLRLVPVFPFWLVNLVPAFLGVGLPVYVATTFFGILPGTTVYALVGNGLGAALDAGTELDLGVIFEPQFLAPILGLALLSLLPAVLRGLGWWPRAARRAERRGDGG